jgi:hypothetical protein
MWSIGKAAHRVIGQGKDPTGLGRWIWTRYRGRNNTTLKIFSAYRPKPPSEGPFTVHAQHRAYFNSSGEDRCPRRAFLEDICKDISIAQNEGDNTIVMLDGNQDMRKGELYEAFTSCNLHEAIIQRHGTNKPSTYIRNSSNTPIDGIWCNPGLSIKSGGYCEFDQVFNNTNHRTIWIEVTYLHAFGHNMPPIIRPQARRLQCKDPRCVDNYIKILEKYIDQHGLLTKAQLLQQNSTHPLSLEEQQQYEELDKLRCVGVAQAEKKCRKLRMGNVDFSPTVQLYMRAIRAWNLLIKKAKGLKVSSRMLARSLCKANLTSQTRSLGLPALEDNLKQAYTIYYTSKGNASSLRGSALEARAEAWAMKNQLDKAKVVLTLKPQEAQRQTARRIKYLRGKMSMGSTTVISVQNREGTWNDVMEKGEMELEIMKANEFKFQQSFQSPFYTPPLVSDFGYLGTGRAAESVLDGTYHIPPGTDPYAAQLISHLTRPPAIDEKGQHPTSLPLETDRKYWRKA